MGNGFWGWGNLCGVTGVIALGRVSAPSEVGLRQEPENFADKSLDKVAATGINVLHTQETHAQRFTGFCTVEVPCTEHQ